MSDSKIVSVQTDLKRKQIIIRFQAAGEKGVRRFGFHEKEKLAEFKRQFATDARAAALALINDPQETEEPG